MSVFSWILTRERIPQVLAEWMISTIDSRIVFMLIVNLLLLFIGLFIEGNALMLVLVPLLAPIAKVYGINEIHFAMVFIFNMSIGALTPPVGTLMFVTCSITKCKTRDFIIEAVPFYIMLLIDLALLIYFPILSTGLVDLIY